MITDDSNSHSYSHTVLQITVVVANAIARIQHEHEVWAYHELFYYVWVARRAETKQ